MHIDTRRLVHNSAAEEQTKRFHTPFDPPVNVLSQVLITLNQCSTLMFVHVNVNVFKIKKCHNTIVAKIAMLEICSFVDHKLAVFTYFKCIFLPCTSQCCNYQKLSNLACSSVKQRTGCKNGTMHTVCDLIVDQAWVRSTDEWSSKNKSIGFSVWQTYSWKVKYFAFVYRSQKYNFIQTAGNCALEQFIL